MPNRPVPPRPSSATLGVMTGGETGIPVTRDEVERAVWTFTGWQLGQELVDELMNVIDAYALELDMPSFEAALDQRLGMAQQKPAEEAVVAQEEPVERPEPDRRDRVLDWLQGLLERYGERTLLELLANVEERITAAVAVPNPPVASSVFVHSGSITEMVPESHGAEPSEPIWTSVEPVQAPRVSRCTKCGEVKSLEKFGKDSTRTSGYKSRCKTCLNIEHVERRARKKQAKLDEDPGSTR